MHKDCSGTSEAVCKALRSCQRPFGSCGASLYSLEAVPDPSSVVKYDPIKEPVCTARVRC